MSRVFFFQAEDGIRDIGVTGVQTCALPIFAHGAQITPRKIHLYSKHHEDKHHHEQPETKRAQELGNRLMRRILGQQTVVHITSRAGISTPPTDRKSTRLNSSHANISYAVFCLKKKN